MRPVLLVVASLLFSASALDAKSRKVVEPLEPSIVAAHHVADVEVVIAPTAAETFAKIEAKAAEKRREAGLAPVESLAPDAPRPAPEQYATLPFSVMFPLVMQDVTREWGLKEGPPVKLKVTIDSVKTANAAVAWLGASSDQMAGMVEVLEPASGRPLGSFYIDVINSHGGLLGMAIRGAGIREKLAEEFALESSRVLTGRKSKTPKAARS